MTATPTNQSGNQSGGNSGLTPLASKVYQPPERVLPQTNGVSLKQWPRQLTTIYPDHMEFLAYKYVSYADYYTTAGISISGSSTNATPTTGTAPTTQSGPSTGNTANTSTSSNSATTAVTADYAGRPTANQRFIRGTPLDRIRLPVPNTIQFSDGPNWSTEPIGIMGTQLGAVVKSLESGSDQVATNLQKMAQGLQSEIALKAISGTGLFGSAEAITQGIGGKIQNPYTEQIFKGIEPRSFSFNWRLVPRNKEEQTQIDELIRAFRYNSLPDYSAELTPNGQASPGDNLSDRWLTVPSVWNIRFFSGGNEMKYIPLLKVCVIKNITVNFTPDNVWSTHLVDASQPAPVAYDLSIEFQEVEIITRTEVEKERY